MEEVSPEGRRVSLEEFLAPDAGGSAVAQPKRLTLDEFNAPEPKRITLEEFNAPSAPMPKNLEEMAVFQAKADPKYALNPEVTTNIYRGQLGIAQNPEANATIPETERTGIIGTIQDVGRATPNALASGINAGLLDPIRQGASALTLTPAAAALGAVGATDTAEALRQTRRNIIEGGDTGGDIVGGRNLSMNEALAPRVAERLPSQAISAWRSMCSPATKTPFGGRRTSPSKFRA